VANRFAEVGLEVVEGAIYKDHGDLEIIGHNPVQIHDHIRSAVSTIAQAGPTCILGGDHAIAYPIISAIAEHHTDLQVLQVDAHADLYENFDDNHYSHASPFARILEEGKIKKLTQVGIRTLSTHQKEQAKRYNVDIVEMKNFSLDFLEALEGPLYISLDLDGIDPAYAPGVSHHEPGGLSSRMVIHIIQSIQVPIIGCDIVEYNPRRDINHVTAMLSYKLMKELIAKMHASQEKT